MPEVLLEAEDITENKPVKPEVLDEDRIRQMILEELEKYNLLPPVFNACYLAS